MAYRELELTLLSARDLKKVSRFTSMNVYAVASISGDPMTRQVTPTDTSGGRNPSWNTTVRFSVPPSRDAAAAAPGGGGWLHVLLRSERARGDRDIGEVIIPLAELLADADGPGPQPLRVDAYQVHTVHRGKPRGVLNVSYRLGPVVAPVKRFEDKPRVITDPYHPAPTNYGHNIIIGVRGAGGAVPTRTTPPRSSTTTTAVAAKADDGPRSKPSNTPTWPNVSPKKTDNSWPKEHHDTPTWPNTTPKKPQQVDTKVVELAHTQTKTGIGKTDHPTKPKSEQEQSNNFVIARKTQIEEYASLQSNSQPGKAESTRPKEAYGNTRSNSTPPGKADHHQPGHKTVQERERVHSLPTATAR